MGSGKTFLKRLTAGILVVSHCLWAVGPAVSSQGLLLPEPGAMVLTTPAFMPVMMKGLKVHPENPLLFDFIIDTGTSGLATASQDFKTESEKLIKYFLASLTIREDDLWVNLSPYEKDRMLTPELGQTELGRDMLAQDYILKQLTASLIYPEKDLGKAFWAKVYAKAQEKFGTTDIPLDTFNKVWITADRAKVLERSNAAYVVGGHLKVMLESDYLAQTRAESQETREEDVVPPQMGSVDSPLASRLSSTGSADISKQVLREIIIPQIEKEVNEGANFAPLRQMFYTMILSSWYKLALKEAFLSQVYGNKWKVAGVGYEQGAMPNMSASPEDIYQRYLAAYRKGVFSYIKDEADPAGAVIPRKYFSGGFKVFDQTPAMLIERVQTPGPGDDTSKVGDMALITTTFATPGVGEVLGRAAARLRQGFRYLLLSYLMTGGFDAPAAQYRQFVDKNGRPQAWAQADQGEDLTTIIRDMTRQLRKPLKPEQLATVMGELARRNNILLTTNSTGAVTGAPHEGQAISIWGASEWVSLFDILNNSRVVATHRIALAGERPVEVYFVRNSSGDKLKGFVAMTFYEPGKIILNMDSFDQQVKTFRRLSKSPASTWHGLYPGRDDAHILKGYALEMLYHEFIHTKTWGLIRSPQFAERLARLTRIWAGEPHRIADEVLSYLAQISVSEEPWFILGGLIARASDTGDPEAQIYASAAGIITAYFSDRHGVGQLLFPIEAKKRGRVLTPDEIKAMADRYARGEYYKNTDDLNMIATILKKLPVSVLKEDAGKGFEAFSGMKLPALDQIEIPRAAQETSVTPGVGEVAPAMEQAPQDYQRAEEFFQTWISVLRRYIPMERRPQAMEAYDKHLVTPELQASFDLFVKSRGSDIPQAEAERLVDTLALLKQIPDVSRRVELLTRLRDVRGAAELERTLIGYLKKYGTQRTLSFGAGRRGGVGLVFATGLAALGSALYQAVSGPETTYAIPAELAVAAVAFPAGVALARRVARWSDAYQDALEESFLGAVSQLEGTFWNSPLRLQDALTGEDEAAKRAVELALLSNGLAVTAQNAAYLDIFIERDPASQSAMEQEKKIAVESGIRGKEVVDILEKVARGEGTLDAAQWPVVEKGIMDTLGLEPGVPEIVLESVMKPLVAPASKEKIDRLFDPDFIPGTFMVGERMKNPEFLAPSDRQNMREWVNTQVASELARWKRTWDKETNGMDKYRYGRLLEYVGLQEKEWGISLGDAVFLLLLLHTSGGERFMDIIPNQIYQDVFNRVMAILVAHHPYNYPYSDKDFNEKMGQLMQKILPRIADLPLESIFRYSVAAGALGLDLKSNASAASIINTTNVIPYNVPGETEDGRVERMFHALQEKADRPLAINFWKEFEGQFITPQEPRTLVFFHDDYGETQVDLLFITKLLQANPHLKVVSVPRHSPAGWVRFGNDAHDADWWGGFFKNPALAPLMRIHIEEGRYQFSKEGPVWGAVNGQEFSDEVADLVAEGDAIVVKGARSYEMLQGINKPAYFAYMVCREFSESVTGVDSNTGLSVFIKQEVGLPSFQGFRERQTRDVELMDTGRRGWATLMTARDYEEAVHSPAYVEILERFDGDHLDADRWIKKQAAERKMTIAQFILSLPSTDETDKATPAMEQDPTGQQALVDLAAKNRATRALEDLGYSYPQALEKAREWKNEKDALQAQGKTRGDLRPEDRVKFPRGFWTRRDTVVHYLLAALDLNLIDKKDPGRSFERARKAKDIKLMAALYREFVLGYKALDQQRYHDGQQAFFYEVCGMESLMNNNRQKILRKKASPGALMELVAVKGGALEGLVDPDSQEALKPWELEEDYWTEETAARAAVNALKWYVPGFEEALAVNDIPRMTDLYRQHVLNYPIQDTKRYRWSEQAFFYEKAGLEGLLSHTRPFWKKLGSPEALMESVASKIPELKAWGLQAVRQEEADRKRWESLSMIGGTASHPGGGEGLEKANQAMLQKGLRTAISTMVAFLAFGMTTPLARGATNSFDNFYATAAPHIQVFKDNALTAGFPGFTRSYQGAVASTNATDIGQHGASSYDLTILARVQLYANNTTILDTFISNWEQHNNQVFNYNNGYRDASGNPLNDYAYNMIRITGRDVPSWWTTWDWNVEQGGMAELINLSLEAYQKLGDAKYLNFARGMADALIKLQDSDGGFRFGPVGIWHPSGNSFFWDLKVTEKNERIFNAMNNLAVVTNDGKYIQSAADAKQWLLSMYDNTNHLFYTSSQWNGVQWQPAPLGTTNEYFATDSTAMAPKFIFTDPDFRATQQERDDEIEDMFLATERRTAVLNAAGLPIAFRFSGSQSGDHISVEWTAQMANAYLRAAQFYRGKNEERFKFYYDRYRVLVFSLKNTFMKPYSQDPAAQGAPYASGLDGSVAVGSTGTGILKTEGYEFAAASQWVVFPFSGFDPGEIDGGEGIPEARPVISAIQFAPTQDHVTLTIEDPVDALGYDLLSATDLKATWTRVATNVPTSGTGETKIDVPQAGSLKRFYKVELAMAPPKAGKIQKEVRAALTAEEKQKIVQGILRHPEVRPEPRDMMEWIRRGLSVDDINKVARTMRFSSLRMPLTMREVNELSPFLVDIAEEIYQFYGSRPYQTILFAGRDAENVYDAYMTLAALRGWKTRARIFPGSMNFWRHAFLPSQEFFEYMGLTPQAFARNEHFTLIDSGFQGSVYRETLRKLQMAYPQTPFGEISAHIQPVLISSSDDKQLELIPDWNQRRSAVKPRMLFPRVGSLFHSSYLEPSTLSEWVAITLQNLPRFHDKFETFRNGRFQYGAQEKDLNRPWSYASGPEIDNPRGYNADLVNPHAALLVQHRVISNLLHPGGGEGSQKANQAMKAAELIVDPDTLVVKNSWGGSQHYTWMFEGGYELEVDIKRMDGKKMAAARLRTPQTTYAGMIPGFSLGHPDRDLVFLVEEISRQADHKIVALDHLHDLEVRIRGLEGRVLDILSHPDLPVGERQGVGRDIRRVEEMILLLTDEQENREVMRTARDMLARTGKLLHDLKGPAEIPKQQGLPGFEAAMDVPDRGPAGGLASAYGRLDLLLVSIAKRISGNDHGGHKLNALQSWTALAKTLGDLQKEFEAGKVSLAGDEADVVLSADITDDVKARVMVLETLGRAILFDSEEQWTSGGGRVFRLKYRRGALFEDKGQARAEFSRFLKTAGGHAKRKLQTLSGAGDVLHGGIDLNSRKMGWDVIKEGTGVQMTVDPALIEQFRSGDFSGLTPVILKITPISGPLPVLGLSAETPGGKTLSRVSHETAREIADLC